MVKRKAKNKVEDSVRLRRTDSLVTVRKMSADDPRFATGPRPGSESEDTVEHRDWYRNVRGQVESDSAVFKSYQEKARIDRERIAELLKGLSEDLMLDESGEGDDQEVNNVFKGSTANLTLDEEGEIDSQSAEELLSHFQQISSRETERKSDGGKDAELVRSLPADLMEEERAKYDNPEVEEVVKNSSEPDEYRPFSS